MQVGGDLGLTTDVGKGRAAPVAMLLILNRTTVTADAELRRGITLKQSAPCQSSAKVDTLKAGTQLLGHLSNQGSLQATIELSDAKHIAPPGSSTTKHKATPRVT